MICSMQRGAGPVVAALILFGAAAAQAETTCAEGKRIAHSSASCLEASWTNTRLLNGHYRITYTVAVEEDCREAWPSITVRLAKSDGGNITHKLGYSADKTLTKTIGESTGRVTGAYCCSDASDICNLSEISDESCAAEFAASPANDSCEALSIAETDDHWCEIEAYCDGFLETQPEGTSEKDAKEKVKERVTRFGDVGRLENDGGRLKLPRGGG